MSAGEEAGEPREPLRDLRRRLLLLARLLPVEHLRLLDADLEELEAETGASDFVQGLSDSVELSASDVETALREVWARMQAG